MKRRYETLDLMRGIAALMVVFLHWRWALSPVYSAPNAGLAVDIFFLLSGFVIAHTFDPRFAAGLKFLKFVRQRLWRLQPTIWLGLAMGTALMVLQFARGSLPGVSAFDLIASTALNAVNLPYKVPGNYNAFAVNSPQWSLLHEMLVNFIFAAIWGFLALPCLRLLVIVAGMAMVALSLNAGSAMLGSHFDELAYGFARAMFSFFLGVLVYRTRERWEPRIPVLPPLAVGLILFVILGVPALGRFELAYDLAVQLVAAPLLVMLGSRSEPGTKRSREICELFGAISFPLYATHVPIKNWATGIAPVIGMPDWLCAVITIPLSVVAGFLIGKLFEMRRRPAAAHLVDHDRHPPARP